MNQNRSTIDKGIKRIKLHFRKLFVCLGTVALLLWCNLSYAGDVCLLVSRTGTISYDNDHPYMDVRALKKQIKKRGTAISAFTVVRNHLDSLGFFNSVWDTISADSLKICPGKRTIVQTIKISGCSLSVMDSLNFIVLPRPYDAGELENRAKEIVRKLAETGYPFALVSVDFLDRHKVMGEKNADTVGLQYTVSTGKPYRFWQPVMYGKNANRALFVHDIRFDRGDIFDIRKVEQSSVRLNSRQYVSFAHTESPLVVKDQSLVGNETAYFSQDTGYVAIPFFVTDRSNLNFEGAAGFEAQQTDGPMFHGDVTVSFLNLFHAGERASLLYSGERTFQHLKLSLEKPWLFDLPLFGRIEIGLELEEKQYGYSYGQVELLAEFLNGWRTGIGLKGSEVVPDSTGIARHFYGVDFLLKHTPMEYVMGQLSREFAIRTGSGVARREKSYTRSNVDFAGGIHVPLWRKYAIVSRFATKNLLTKEEFLTPAEMYRVGGYRSVRGYGDGEFPLKNVFYGQFESLFYFTTTSSVFIFLDGGVGFEKNISLDEKERKNLLGYGLGVRIPVRLGTLILAWARNWQDKRGFGRVHVQLEQPGFQSW